MHHWRVLFDGGKTLRRSGIDFAWNVHVVKIRDGGPRSWPDRHFTAKPSREERMWGLFGKVGLGAPCCLK
jgi:hypothetical protein